MNSACISLGDCGASLNYIGVEGYYDAKAIYSGDDGEEEEE